ncbi:AAA family ATPase [Flavobacterium cheonhonense]|uniref:AAA family ATPase n=1 Tax=Flavobacterium cheonhonense TaxID=706185 RepID=A0ABP7TJ70_9FLAO|nr:hypothetical protein [Flavobacterium cheonhonense]
MIRLAAIYISKGELPHIFGKNHEGQTINLGGKFQYVFEETEHKVFVKSRQINAQFIDGFWQNNICLLSAIVGENGVGKSTILDLFRTSLSACTFVYEDLETNNFSIFFNADLSDVLYYSPHFNIHQVGNENENFRDLSKYSLMIDDTELESFDLSTLLQLHDSENLKRWIKFIESNNAIDLLKDISLPIFDKIHIKINFFRIDEHQISYRFRPFFNRFIEMIDAENTRRQQQELNRLKLTKIEDIRNSRATHKIRLELEVLKRIIVKVQNILESTGNKYLEEGFLNDNYTIESPEFLAHKNTRDAFYWFLDNAYVQLTKRSKKVFLPVDEIKNLIETIILHLPESKEIENWTEFSVGFSEALSILKSYEEFILAFKNDFAFDRKVLLKFKPYVNLSSGEKGLYDLFSVFNDFKFRIENDIHTDYTIFNKRQNVSSNFLILLDEGDLGFHPEWKKKYINVIQQVFTQIFPDKNIQIIITTHDPLTLSDFPRNNITFLKKEGDRAYLHDNLTIKSFGANVSDLFKDSFFIKDGLIGDFAKKKIEEVIVKMNSYLLLKQANKVLEISDVEIDSMKRLIDIIDEPIIQQKLIEMYNTLFDRNYSIDDEISRVEARLKELRNLKNIRND